MLGLHMNPLLSVHTTGVHLPDYCMVKLCGDLCIFIIASIFISFLLSDISQGTAQDRAPNLLFFGCVLDRKRKRKYTVCETSTSVVLKLGGLKE